MFDCVIPDGTTCCSSVCMAIQSLPRPELFAINNV